MYPTIPRSRLRSTNNSASAPSSTTATRISGPSALTTSKLFICETLQFVAPAPERRDMDVVPTACRERVEEQSVARKQNEYKALRHHRPAWPTPCFVRGRAGVAASAPFRLLTNFTRRSAYLFSLVSIERTPGLPPGRLCFSDPEGTRAIVQA